MKKHKKLKFKVGNSILAFPIMLLTSSMFMIIIGVYVINLIIPFLWYEKLNSISQKYMFVIEKYGYLTEIEKSSLLTDLENQGFDISYIEIIAPNIIKNYGELIEFEIKYKLNQKTPIMLKGNVNLSENDIDIVVKKYSYSKR